MNVMKSEFKYFTITEWEKEQYYLRQQHINGWKFVKADFIGIYKFERCEPEDMIYKLDYNSEGTERKSEYIQEYRDCGWEYIQDFFGYSYFRKSALEMDSDKKFFCDDQYRIDLMKRVFAGRMIPLIVTFLLLILPNILSDGMWIGNIFLLSLYIPLSIYYGIQFLKFWISLNK